MSPTFGELATSAEVQLSLAHRYPTFTLHRDELVRMSAVVRTCVERVVRLADTTSRDGRPLLDPDSFWLRALQDFQARLDQVSACAQVLPRRSGDLTDLVPVQRLADAAATIGAAIDLLATHFDILADGMCDRDDLGAYIDSVEGRRAIVVQAARFAGLLSPISRDVALALHAHTGRLSAVLADALLDISEHLAVAAASVPDAVGSGPRVSAALSAIPALEPIRPDLKEPTRDLGLLLRRAIGCAERLHQLTLLDARTTPAPTIDPTALAVTASAFASTQAMTARCIRQLASRGEQIAPRLTSARVGRELHNSAAATECAYQRWLSVRDGLRGRRGVVTRGLGVPMRVEANDLILTIGRLAHTDPQWQPRVGGCDELRPAAELAPTAVSLAELCAGLHRLNAAQALTANRQAHLLRAMARGGQLMLPTRWLPESDYVRRPYTPAPESEIVALVKRYAAARDATAEVAVHIGSLPQHLGCLRPNIAADAELTRWRLPTAWRSQPLPRGGWREPIAVAF
jgi:hypothetical protein